MRCDPATRPRTIADGAVLAVFGLLVLFYAAVMLMILSPRVDEAYRRTFVTGEFGAYPPSRVFEGRNGLDYVPGTLVTLTKSRQRLYLNRFDWPWREPPGPWLRGWRGRIHVHVRDDLRRPDREHRLGLGVACAFPPHVDGRFVLKVNGEPVGGFSCAGRREPFTVVARIPAGKIGSLDYDEITVERTPEGWQDRIATRFGARFGAFSLAWFRIETL